jgi:peptidoglycan/LPS O-acetylase OafA/YrhL
MASEYRADIDGLRALAVVSVIFFHFGRFDCRGGFVGVDVFFVISGFLISRIIAREQSAGSYSSVAFYERRIRRIAPALFLVLAACCVAAWVVLLPRHMESFGKSLLAALPMAANLYFWADSGYFADDAQLKPLLHLWSLAIEEQFYLVFPLLLAAALRRGTSLVRGLLAALTLASFGAGWLMLAREPEAAFYLAPLRVWELLLGACLALGGVPLIRSALARNLLALGALLALGFALRTFDGRMRFPGPAALVPCLAAACLIHAGSSGPNWGSRLLGLKPLVWIGLASYSLYLWHWPLVVFTRHALIGSFRTVHSTRLLWLSFGLGFASWYFVERPLRRLGSRRQVFAAAALATLLLAVFGAAAVWTRGFESRVMRHVQSVPRVKRSTTSEFMRAACHGDRPLYGQHNADLCRLVTDDAEPSFLVWGDSHAQGITPLLETLAGEQGRSGLVSLASACVPMLNIEHGTCAAPGVHLALDDPKLRNVILHARWGTSGDGVVADGGLGLPALRRGLEATLSAAQRFGRRVVVIGPVPEASGHVPDAIARSLWFGSERDVRPRQAEFLAQQAGVLELLRALQAKYGFSLELPHQVLCRGTHCDIMRDNKVLYTDAHHLSEAGVMLLHDMLARALTLPQAPAE